MSIFKKNEPPPFNEINENMSFKTNINKSSTSLGPSEHLLAPTPAPPRGPIATLCHSDYVKGLATRILSLIIILAVLIAIGIGLLYTDGLPKEEDFSHLQFDWKINPASYLTPWNASFQYNVLLDGHSHSTYSDGKMNVRQLLDWHLGKRFFFFYKKKKGMSC